jgi:glucokinase
MMENTIDVNLLRSGFRAERVVILAGDVGGTKTLLGLFDTRPSRPRPIHVRSFVTTEFDGLTDMVGAFAADPAVAHTALSAACFGVAGPVLGATAELTNVPFTIDALAVSRSFTIPHVKLLNDLEAMAYAVPVLEGDELHVLQHGEALRGGNMALIAAGTGLGQALLHNVGGRFVPSPSEGGHADWAARTERDIHVLRLLVSRYGRAEVEHVVSGKGLPNLHRATHPAGCDAGIDPEDPGAPAALTAAALDGRCRQCLDALEIFVDAYGAEAGNAALRAVATGGLFIGGGIAPKILPALTDGRFMRAFHDKGQMRPLVEQVPVKIILNAEAGLLGAAVFAAEAA